MAHVAKYTRGAIRGLSNHLDRKTENHANKDIDVSKTYLNYDLNQTDGDTISRLNKRLEQVYCMNRKDVKAVADWIVTLPKELEDRPADDQRQFFEATKRFLDKQYGEENNISANVHMDETTPHMHYAFIPVVYDNKKEREKVSAKIVLNRNHLQSFHDDLDKHLKAEIPQIYERGVVNGQTVGVETVQELKQLRTQEKALSAEIENLSAKRDTVQGEIKAKTSELSAIELDDTYKSVEAKPVAFQKKYVKVLESDLRKLQDQASTAKVYKAKFESEEEKSKELKHENSGLKAKVKQLENKLNDLASTLTDKELLIKLADGVIGKLTGKYTSNKRGLDYFWEKFQQNYRDVKTKDIDKDRKDRKDGKGGKVNLISDKLNKHSSSGNTQRDKPKREREDRGPSL
ncbi:TPA: MobV family relaxase [Streptococcus suis]